MIDEATSHTSKGNCRLANNVSTVAGYALFLLLSAICPMLSAHAAEETRPAYTPPSPAVSSGSIVQIIFSLLLVLAAIVLVAWLLKRMNVAQQGSGNLLKVLGGVAIGQRERIVLVEMQDTWLVVGVGPGQIRTLHTLQKPDGIGQDTMAASQSAEPRSFSAVLSSALGSLSSGKRKQQHATVVNMNETNVEPANASSRSHNAP
jgi:flagellar protein FliO/FliZ